MGHGVRNQGSGVRDQGTGDRSQKSEERKNELSCGSGFQPRSCALNDFYEFNDLNGFNDFNGLPFTAYC